MANLPTCGPLLILSPGMKRWGPPPYGLGHVAHPPTCGPLLILSPGIAPGMKLWEAPGSRGHVANAPTCGPFLILSPAVKHWEPPIRQGSGSQSHLWATTHFVPRYEALGTPTPTAWGM